MKNRAPLAASLAALSAASSLHAQTRVVYVDQSAPPNGDGTSWQRAFRDLQRAFDLANASRSATIEMRVAQGTYRPTVTASGHVLAFSFVGAFSSSSTISLLGSFAGLRGLNPNARDFISTPTVLSGDTLGDDTPDGSHREDNAGTVLYAAPGHGIFDPILRMDGVTVEGAAEGDEYSGAVWLSSYSGYVVVTHCTFRNNLRTGLAFIGRESMVQDCSFIHNSGGNGGGLRISSSSATVERCRFESNSAVNGGALFCDGSNVTCSNLRVVGNTAFGHGGGIYGAFIVQNCLVAGNHAVLGGGLYTNAYISNCTIAHNFADWGGGIHTSGCSIDNSIFNGNRAARDGHQASLTQGILYVRQSIVEGGASGVLLAFDSTLLPINMFEFSPGFVDPSGPDGDVSTWRDNDYHLRPNSRAINQGMLSMNSPTDLDGNPRVRSRYPGGPAIPDLGCYEYQPHCPADINQDNGITVDDLLAFLTAYTQGNLLADIDDGSGTNTPDDGVTIEDLLYFLARYNQGC